MNEWETLGIYRGCFSGSVSITYEKFPNSFESNHLIGIHLTDIAFEQVNDE